MTGSSNEPILPRKRDPEPLVLCGSLPLPIRFRRGLIIGLSALALAAVVGIAWVALRPPHAHVTPAPDDDPVGKASTETLAALPSTYGAVPKLGPPLPGDLGKPILDHGREGPVAVPPLAPPARTPAPVDPRRAAAEAALASPLLVDSAARTMASGQGGARPITAPAATGAASPSKPIASDPERDPNDQQRKADFAAGGGQGPDIDPHPLRKAPSPYTLSAGSVIAASLITGLRSDLPGPVIAQVTADVFDTATGQIDLIPQGARLLGTYDSVIAFGQRRAMVVWKRILFPDGGSIDIDNAPATDTSGYAGLEDKVDFHTWRMLEGVGLSTLLGVGTQLSFGGEDGLVRALRESAQDNSARVGDQLTRRNLDAQPTITVRPGAEVRLVVDHDLVLAPWREGR